MTRPVILRRAAEMDIQLIHDELEQLQTDLGLRFVSHVRETLSRIEHMPKLYGVTWKNVRAARIRKFRHLVYYKVYPDHVDVLAVMHGARDASAWRSRV